MLKGDHIPGKVHQVRPVGVAKAVSSDDLVTVHRQPAGQVAPYEASGTCDKKTQDTSRFRAGMSKASPG